MNSSDDAKTAFAKRLNDALTEKGYPQRGSAQRLKREAGFDISDRAINKWLKAETLPDHHNIELLAKFLGVNFNWLAAGQGEKTFKPSRDDLMQKIRDIENQDKGTDYPTPEGTTAVRMTSQSSMVPILSWVAAGSWSNVEAVTFEDAIGQAPRPANLSKFGFALRVQGQSMLPEFKPSEIIYVEPQTGFLALKDSDLVIVQCNDDKEATFKQLVLGETSDDMYLRPLNPNWPEQRMMPMGECNLVGKVVGKYVEY
ncbi:LexA family protein [Psychrobacter aquaticus]|uniref:Phage repressor n=1 Tax=Psychrobacter aquaticus CMS 56 TaxID=1354303 RepID=U4T252_9GAMM|nr:S24 family peptidase [Psychrobacter aquaticus]ERL54977.1 Phage repressor [Psychrobacter aquaticus CMS 56]